MSFTDEMLRSFEELPRETGEGKDSGRESGRKALGTEASTADVEAVSAPGKGEGTSREEKAIRDMRRVLFFLEKKVRGTLSGADRQEIRDSTEEWTESMEVLRRYVERQ